MNLMSGTGDLFGADFPFAVGSAADGNGRRNSDELPVSIHHR
jgi:hypothetical protein